ncbi:MAG: biopolymer transporter ExbD [Burkholderiales bacterium]|nr:biopolymer transporter ExbD [Burkholderiales bacterium]
MITSKSKHEIKASEPNLIPILDFMLVLIIMFVLLAGPVREAIKVPVPEVKNGTAAQSTKHTTLIIVAGKNDIYIDKNHFSSLDNLEKYLETQKNIIKEVSIAIDKSLEVDILLKLFSINKALGISTTNIQVETKK